MTNILNIELIWFLKKTFLNNNFLIFGNLSRNTKKILISQTNIFFCNSIESTLLTIFNKQNNIKAIVQIVDLNTKYYDLIKILSRINNIFIDYLIFDISGSFDVPIQYNQILSKNFFFVKKIPLLYSLNEFIGIERYNVKYYHVLNKEIFPKILGAWNNQSLLSKSFYLLNSFKKISIIQYRLGVKLKKIKKNIDKNELKIFFIKKINLNKISLVLKYVSIFFLFNLIYLFFKKIYTSKKIIYISIVKNKRTNDCIENTEEKLVTNYDLWVKKFYDYSNQELENMRQKIYYLKKIPKFSLIFNIQHIDNFLIKYSLLNIFFQIYPFWELCISDKSFFYLRVKEIFKLNKQIDERIKITIEKNILNPSNSIKNALNISNGDFFILISQNDLISKHALFILSKYINYYPESSIFYSDEDKIDINGKRFNPIFKSDWNIDLIRCRNFLSNLCTYKLDIFNFVGGFRKNFYGSKDYDLILRCIDTLRCKKPIHIPYILYHSIIFKKKEYFLKKIEINSYLNSTKSIKYHLKRKKIKASVMEIFPNRNCKRILYSITNNTFPFVSIIVNLDNNLFVLKRCIKSIINITDYENFEIIIINQLRNTEHSYTYLNNLIKQKKRINILKNTNCLNYSYLNNYAVKISKGNFICMISSYVEVICSNWLKEMIGLSYQHDVGSISASLWYPNNTLYHGGILLGVGGVAGYSNYLLNHKKNFFYTNLLNSDFLALTSSCLLVKKNIYSSIGGLNEKLAINFNDIDLCIRIKNFGYRNVFTPNAKLLYHKSFNKINFLSVFKRKNFIKEAIFIQNRWKNLLFNDPYHNPNLSLIDNNFCFCVSKLPRVIHSY